VNRIIEMREKSKGGHSGEAHEILKNVSEKQVRIEAAMLEARSAGYELIERERAEAVAARQERIGAVKAAVSQLVEQENQDLDAQAKAARAAIAAEAGQLADRISANILKSA
jgi:F0F1-type ATP synthase membrane subunit b/b'